VERSHKKLCVHKQMKNKTVLAYWIYMLHILYSVVYFCQF